MSLVFLLLCVFLQCTQGEKYYIVVSSANPCPLEFDERHCLTLQEFATNSTTDLRHGFQLKLDSSDNLTLELGPGNHALDTPIRVRGGNAFEFKGVGGTVRVTCKRNLNFVGGELSLGRVQSGHISGVSFVNCDTNSVFDVSELLITDAHFRLFRQSAFRISGTTNATILRSSFSHAQCFSHFCPVYLLSVHGSSLQLEACSFYNTPLKSNGGGINIDNSDVVMEKCSFRNITGRSGGAIRVTNSRDRTLLVTNSTFHGNMAKRNGGAIYINGSDIMLDGCKFTNNTAYSGGAIFATGLNVSVSIARTKFSSNMAETTGGAVLTTDRDGPLSPPVLSSAVDNSVVIIGHSEFRDNIATDGGAVAVLGSRQGENSLRLTQNTFRSNMATSGSGGAIIMRRFGFNSVEQSVFIGNEADRDGGAIIFSRDGASLSVQTCTFANNTAHSGSGGAIAYPLVQRRAAGTVLINKSNFTGNRASFCGALDVIRATVMATMFSYNRATTGPRSSNTWKTMGGGAICARHTPTLLLNSTFAHNIAEEIGGGVLNTLTGASIEGCTFYNNRAGRNGGVILHHIGAVTIARSNFSNNQAADNGGAVHGRSVSINEVNFYNNAASGFGGSLYATSADVSDSYFINNRASMDGGALFLSCTSCRAQTATIQRCNFTNNEASQGVGGAVFITRHNVSLTESTFSNNYASSCGALAASWSVNFRPFRPYSLNATRCTFTHNRQTGVGRRRIGGGGAMCLKSGLILIVDSNCSHNTARERGGVMEVDNSTVVIEGSLFDNNTARSDGGVAHTGFSNLPATFEISQSSFTSNQVTIGDGGVFNLEVEGSKINLSKGTLGYNTAGNNGGAFHIEGASLVVTDTRIFNNTARRGNTISSCDSNISISSNDIYDITPRARTDNCFFYDLVGRSTIIPSATVSLSFSTPGASTAFTPTEVSVITQSRILTPSEVRTLTPSKVSITPSRTLTPSEVRTLTPSKVSINSITPSRTLSPRPPDPSITPPEINTVAPSKTSIASSASEMVAPSKVFTTITASEVTAYSLISQLEQTNTMAPSGSSTTSKRDTFSVTAPTNRGIKTHFNIMMVFLCLFPYLLSSL